MTQRVVITDIDSTMSDHWMRIRHNTVPRWPGGHINAKAWSREEVLQDELLPNCRSVLYSLEQSGFYIRYLTARGWTHSQRITIEQLTGWDVPNPQDVIVCKSMSDKVDILSPAVCVYYIDDFMTGQENSIGTFHADVARAIEAKGVRVIPFRNDWADVWWQIAYYEGVTS